MMPCRGGSDEKTFRRFVPHDEAYTRFEVDWDRDVGVSRSVGCCRASAPERRARLRRSGFFTAAARCVEDPTSAILARRRRDPIVHAGEGKVTFRLHAGIFALHVIQSFFNFRRYIPLFIKITENFWPKFHRIVVIQSNLCITSLKKTKDENFKNLHSKYFLL